MSFSRVLSVILTAERSLHFQQRRNTAADDYAADFRRDWETNYAKTGESWETYRPAYEYGYRMASDDRYRGREWSEVESDLRSDYSTRYPDSAWERMKAAVRRGWDKVTASR